MKILLVHHNYKGEGGGILTYCHEVKNLLDVKEDFEVEILSLEPEPHFLFKRKFNTDKLREAIKHSNPDVVHVNGTTSFCAVQGIKVAKELGIRVVLTPHWHPFRYMNHPFLSKLYFYSIIRNVLARVDAIITINKEEYEFFSRFHKRVELIPHWLRNRITFSMGEKKIPNSILFVGRLNDRNKGSEHLYHLPIGKYQISCVGKGHIPDREDIRQFHNLTDAELKNKYKETSLVIIPSRYEAFSYVAMEALSFGIPILISDRVRIVDSIQDASTCCQIFKYGDFDDLLSKIDSTISLKFDPHKILTLLLPEIALSKYESLYLKLKI